MRAPVVPLVRACHPEPTAAVTGVTVALAAAAGRSVWGVVGVGFAVLAGQLSVGWSNDWIDSSRDVLAGRTDKPVALGVLPARLVRAAAFGAVAAAVPLSLLSGWRAALVHLVAIGLAWAYNLGLKSSRFSVLPYAVAFALLPGFVALGLPAHGWPPWWALLAGGLLGAGAHFANVLPDLDEDALAGVRGLPHRLGAAWSRRTSALLLVCATAVLALGPGEPRWFSVVGLALAVLLVAGGLGLDRRTGSRTAFRATLLVAVLDVALLIARGSSLG